MRPRIGITSGSSGHGWDAGGALWRPYAEAVERAGGEPVHLGASVLGRERAAIAPLQGLLLSGGRDIDLRSYPNPPELRGEDPEAVMERFSMQPEPERDAWELPLAIEALERDLPVLGICRGCQVLTVVLGGRLLLDIPSEVEGAVEHRASGPESSHHALQVREGTLLSEILDPARLRACNSRHHQAARVDGAFPARVAAVCPEDEVVEAIEAPDRRWALGVQWHPEHPRDAAIRELSAPLFAAFVAAAR